MASSAIGELRVQTTGRHRGRPLLLLHAAITQESCLPLLHAPELGDRRLIHFSRRGYGGVPSADSFSIAAAADDAIRVLDGLQLDAADVVCHSLSTLIAMQMAHDHPTRVRSLVLIEQTFVSRQQLLTEFQVSLQPVVAAYAERRRADAVDAFFRVVDGPDYRQTFDRAYPSGWFARACESLPVYFESELPAAVGWALPPGRPPFEQPALLVRGGRSPRTFGEVFDELRASLPDQPAVTLHHCGHSVAACDSGLTASVINGFLSGLDHT